MDLNKRNEVYLAGCIDSISEYNIKEDFGSVFG